MAYICCVTVGFVCCLLDVHCAAGRRLICLSEMEMSFGLSLGEKVECAGCSIRLE